MPDQNKLSSSASAYRKEKTVVQWSVIQHKKPERQRPNKQDVSTTNYHLQHLLFNVVHTGANYNGIYVFRKKIIYAVVPLTEWHGFSCWAI